MHKILFRFWCLMALSSIFPGAQAVAGTGTLPVAETEIAYLLQFVTQSKCEFYRNGRWYSPIDAQLHLQNKHKLLVSNHQINTAEDFIEKVATRSSLSGLAYKIKCGSADPMPSSQWLLGELGRYRAVR